MPRSPKIEGAAVFLGNVHYFHPEKHQRVQIPDVVMVELRPATESEQTASPRELSAYLAATLLGINPENIHWLPAGDEDSGDRKFLITGGVDEERNYLSLPEDQARIIAVAINKMLRTALKASVQLQSQVDTTEN